MERQLIEGPDPYKPRLTSKEAAQWLGIGEDLFESLMSQHLPTVAPIQLGKYKVWAWLDIAVIGYVLSRATFAVKRAGKNTADTTADE